MTFLSKCGADKSFLFQQREGFSLIKWIHNDFMYVRFGGIRNTKTWSKSTHWGEYFEKRILCHFYVHR